MKRTVAEWKILIAAERKKAGALGVLVVVMAVLGVRQAMPSMRPSSARAEDRSSAGESRTGSELDSPVMPRGPVVRVPRPAPVQRDLFRFDPISFPNPPETSPPDPVEQKSVDAADEESVPEVTESPAARVARVRSASGLLRIRSVMFGTSPMAVIEFPDGKRSATRLVRPGDRVMGFLVEEIGAGAVWLEMDGERVELIAER
jgi:hypothetical protein